MVYDRLKRRLDAGGIVILDGATGTDCSAAARRWTRPPGAARRRCTTTSC